MKMRRKVQSARVQQHQRRTQQWTPRPTPHQGTCAVLMFSRTAPHPRVLGDKRLPPWCHSQLNCHQSQKHENETSARTIITNTPLVQLEHPSSTSLGVSSELGNRVVELDTPGICSRPASTMFATSASLVMFLFSSSSPRSCAQKHESRFQPGRPLELYRASYVS